MIRQGCAALLLLAFSWSSSRTALCQPVPVHLKQGSVHGYLLLKSSDGHVIAIGDQVNILRGSQVYSRLIFRFKDGSLDDETTIFRQNKSFQLVSDHHVQKGPSFPQPLDMTVDVPANQVTWRTSKDGKQETRSEHMDLPSDLVNGLMSLVVQNYPANEAEIQTSYIAGGSKPRLVKLTIKRDGRDTYQLAGSKRSAGIFNVHVELGGVTGVIAPLIGKEPADIRVWVAKGEVPAFLKFQGALYEQGPIWTMVLTSPRW